MADTPQWLTDIKANWKPILDAPDVWDARVGRLAREEGDDKLVMARAIALALMDIPRLIAALEGKRDKPKKGGEQ